MGGIYKYIGAFALFVDHLLVLLHPSFCLPYLTFSVTDSSQIFCLSSLSFSRNMQGKNVSHHKLQNALKEL